MAATTESRGIAHLPRPLDRLGALLLSAILWSPATPAQAIYDAGRSAFADVWTYQDRETDYTSNGDGTGRTSGPLSVSAFTELDPGDSGSGQSEAFHDSVLESQGIEYPRAIGSGSASASVEMFERYPSSLMTTSLARSVLYIAFNVHEPSPFLLDVRLTAGLSGVRTTTAGSLHDRS